MFFLSATAENWDSLSFQKEHWLSESTNFNMKDSNYTTPLLRKKNNTQQPTSRFCSSHSIFLNVNPHPLTQMPVACKIAALSQLPLWCSSLQSLCHNFQQISSTQAHLFCIMNPFLDWFAPHSSPVLFWTSLYFSSFSKYLTSGPLDQNCHSKYIS